MDKLAKFAYFLAVKSTYPLDCETTWSINSVVSNRDLRFTSRFWKFLHGALGIKLSFSIAYHPQSNGQTERTIHTLEDMLRACILEMKGS